MDLMLFHSYGLLLHLSYNNSKCRVLWGKSEQAERIALQKSCSVVAKKYYVYNYRFCNLAEYGVY